MSGLNIDVWGPSGWKFLHAITFAYPHDPSSEKKRKMIDFFELIGDVLPCQKCRIHWKNQLLEHPVDADSRETLSKWLLARHNNVNTSNGKKPWSYDDLCAIYDPNCNKCSSKQTDNTFILIVLLITVLIATYILLKIYKLI